MGPGIARATVSAISFMMAALLCAQWKPCDADELMRCLQRNKEKYQAIGDLRLEYELQTFADASDPVAAETTEGRLFCSGTKYRTELSGFITVQDGRTRVVVDSAARRVMLVPRDSAYLNLTSAYSKEVLAGARAIGKQQTLLGTSYRVMFPENAGLDALEITFDGRGWLRRTVIFWRKDLVDQRMFKAPKLVTDFHVPRALDRSAGTAAFDTRPFVLSDHGTYRLPPAMSTYELIDTRVP